MTKEQKKEIRTVLLGRTVLAGDGRIIALEPGLHLSAGVGDGAGAVRFFGIASRSLCFDTVYDPEKTVEAARSSMFEIGRGLMLREMPDAAACLIRYLLTRPVVLAFRYVDGVPVLTAWTGRGLTGWLSMNRAMKAFREELAEGITVSAAEAPKNIGRFIKEKKEKKKKKKGSEDKEAEASKEVIEE